MIKVVPEISRDFERRDRLLRQRDRDLERVGLQLTEAREELDETNRGLIALYSELQEAREAEARLATVVQSSRDAIISMSLDCAIETWNPGATRVLGHCEGDMVGRNVCGDAATSRNTFEKSLERIRWGGHPLPYDTQWFRSDESLIDLAVNVFGLHDISGDLIGFPPSPGTSRSRWRRNVSSSDWRVSTLLPVS